MPAVTRSLIRYDPSSAMAMMMVNIALPTQPNRGEGRKALARAVFHGKRGELRQRYRQGQEDQLGALSLVVNASVLWSTLYMDVAVYPLRQEGVGISDEDKARL